MGGFSDAQTLKWLVEYVEHKYIETNVLILCSQQQEENRAPYSPRGVWDVPQRMAKPQTARRALQNLNWLQKLNCQRPEELNNEREAILAYTRVSTPRSLTLVKPSLPGSAPPTLELGGRTAREGTAPSTEPPHPAKGLRTPVKHKEFQYELKPCGEVGGAPGS